ncbi:exodeoxyribonuclease V subunit alpha [Aliidiomarina maris]|uniref:RecBCD enzyme subunit RecD n=1 Tax=Aliidiomarina maris TaxID=531312 RepID=A0A327WWZ8_9GAMM|nr:exodeoxyribonuclease V subunit alpha [Aliidiomarina maris]RAJ96495.1 DNA helicase/exodeoxyribonuclease V alpha subunit [Aliidiomarina maris]RUO23756.1 exodeoxyribonuclease V subunit alpha [Aliidiomarina maris]
MQTQAPLSVLDILDDWQQQRVVSHLDVALARMLTESNETAAEQQEAVTEVTALLTAVLSAYVSRGHVCLVLADVMADPESLLGIDSYQARQLAVSPGAVFKRWQLPEIIAWLQQSTAVACDPEQDDKVSCPLVLTQGTLYLTRFWYYEQRIRQRLQRRMRSALLATDNVAAMAEQLDTLFGTVQADSKAKADVVPWQKLACANTLRSRFSVITGGPGTGKTYTVVRLLAMLHFLANQAADTTQALRVRLAAPTGKAAARLKSSIQAALSELQQDSALAHWHPILAQIDSHSSTLHRLLGTIPQSRKFRHHAANPLRLDVLIIDEASMVDIEMMDAILDALPKHAQLILLGDKDQLASVEAGAVLGQICAGAEQGHYRQATFEFLQANSAVPLAASLYDPQGPEHLQHVVMLRESRRFASDSGIGKLASAINQADGAEVANLLGKDALAPSFADLHLLQGARDTDTELWQQFKGLCQQGYRPYWSALDARPDATASQDDIDAWGLRVLKAYAGFQILSAVRDGPFGVSGLNQQVQAWLPSMPEQSTWYEGRPVMVSANDYSLNLRNGDIGIALRSPQDETLRVVFEDSQGRLRWILPSRLRHVETAFAMTIHKSQGSEFGHAVVVLPPNDNPVLCRELIYTGVTRAANELTLMVPSWAVLEQSIQRATLRTGRLFT